MCLENELNVFLTEVKTFSKQHEANLEKVLFRFFTLSRNLV